MLVSFLLLIITSSQLNRLSSGRIKHYNQVGITLYLHVGGPEFQYYDTDHCHDL
jgi:hypothetical protein